jgi:serine/threonine-protein kinase
MQALRDFPLPDNLQQELEAALSGAYAIERELGGGGMSRVFLASERALRRKVVIKVLSPELARGVSADRFRLEIQVAASLQHPHVVPLLAAGEASGHLYYTMPFVAGESLRARLSREGELPVAAALHILRDITRALAHAHRHAIVHRDIKPDNVLLAEGEALVADFGIAKAISASSDAGTLTSAGLALGTPVYMAPEQAMADPTADHRADLYAVGVVGYEMLAGQPPFTGRTPQQLIAAHATEMPVALEQRRTSVPPAFARLIMRLLQKRPSDRPQSADEVLAALDAIGTPAEGTATVAVRQQVVHRGRWLAAGGVVAAAVVLSLAWLSGRARPAATDRQVVAIAPFRVSGADSSLAYLREGMVDLLATKLGGTANLRPADPRRLLAAWGQAGQGSANLREPDAVRVAAEVGAGRLVEGEVVGTGSRLTLNARIIDVPGGSVTTRATAEGSADSLTQLVDRLAASLLALGAGEEEQRLAALTSTSLPALRAYLDGEALLRRGVFHEAEKRFQEALALDTTFALAGLGTARANEWYSGDPTGAVSAWRHRERLSRRDLARLETILGPRYPAPATPGQQIDAAERFVALAPDSPDAWYKLGDHLFHFGPLAGLSDTYRRTDAAFDRSLALDSTYAPTIQHLHEIAAGLGDSTGVRRGLELLQQFDSVSPNAQGRRWQVAAFLGDTAEIRSALATDSILAVGPFYIVFYSLDLPLDLRGTEEVYPRAHAASATADERGAVEFIWRIYELMRGRPSRAVRVGKAPTTAFGLGATVIDGVFADGDSAATRTAAGKLEAHLGRPLAAGDEDNFLARYAIGQYGILVGRPELARRASNDLRAARADSGSAWQSDAPRLAALLLDAQVEMAGQGGAANELMQQLDSALADPVNLPLASVGNLIAARLHESRGEIPAALDALRRRYVGVATFPYYATYLREEGRLAALAGEREGAIRAYRHYLALRSEAEPSLQPEVRRVQEELEALSRESTDR